MLYAVHWPTEGVFKVGVTRHMDRVRRFTGTGARIVILMREPAAGAEPAALKALASRFERAFANPEASSALLPAGRGFSECFKVDARQLPLAFALVARSV